MGKKSWSDGTPIIRDVAEPWGSVPAERWVRVKAEICSGGLWDASGCARCAEDLPISTELRARIECWQDWHDDLDDQNTSFPEPFYWEQRNDMPITDFNAEGRAIGRALKAELPPDWTVIVVDVDAWCRLRADPDADGTELILRGDEPSRQVVRRTEAPLAREPHANGYRPGGTARTHSSTRRSKSG